MSAKKILNTESSLIPGIIDLVCKQNFWKLSFPVHKQTYVHQKGGRGGGVSFLKKLQKLRLLINEKKSVFLRTYTNRGCSMVQYNILLKYVI